MKYSLLLAFILGVFFTSCKIEDPKPGKIKTVVCTTSLLADATAQVVGDSVEVKYIMGPGVDPHEYVPTKKDRDLLLNADVILYHGLHLEAMFEETFESLKKQKKRVINVGNGFSKGSLLPWVETGCCAKDNKEESHSHDSNGHHNNSFDPHVWNDPMLWKDATIYIGAELGKIDSTLTDFFNTNATNYAKELDELDSWATTRVNEIPDSMRVMITAHDAFRYMERRYNIEVKGLQGISTAAEYGIKDMTDMVNLISSRGIKSVFVESSVSDKAVTSLIEGCAAKGHTLTNGGTLYSDALGNEGTEAGTYIGMYKSNINTIVNALK